MTPRKGWWRLKSWVFAHFCGPADRVVHVIFGERCTYCRRSP